MDDKKIGTTSTSSISGVTISRNLRLIQSIIFSFAVLIVSSDVIFDGKILFFHLF